VLPSPTNEISISVSVFFNPEDLITFYLFLGVCTGVWTQGFTLARQALSLSHSTSFITFQNLLISPIL
jgi:hypothetical protein